MKGPWLAIAQLGRDRGDGAVAVAQQPLRRDGWMVYQMSWGESPNVRTGEMVRYTVLQCSKDRGLYWTYAGFGVCLAGILLFKIRSFRQI